MYAPSDAVADPALLQLILESSPDYYFVIGPSGERLFASPSYYRVSGFTPEEIQATDFRTRIHPDDLDVVERARAENFRGNPTQITYRSLCKDGSVVHLELRARPIVDARGNLNRILCCAREVNQQNHPEEVLKSEERRMGVRVLIVDDHTMLRTGLRMLLSSQPDITVVGEAADGMTAVELARKTAPDVVTLDLAMPEVGGLTTLERMRKECPNVRALVLTMHDDAAYLKAVVAAGGAGYVTKTADESEVLAAVRAISQGRTYFSLSINDDLVRALLGEESKTPPVGSALPAEALSQRETEVLVGVAQGYTNQQLADRMLLSIKTIETYRSRLMAKLGLHDRAELVRYAMQKGLLSRFADDQPRVE
jgi:two-component system response regulator NreC